MTIAEFITKHEISHAYLARRIGMKKGTFNNKLNPNHTTQFTTGEKIQLRNILVEMRIDLENIPDVDFNEALKTITK